MDKSIFKHHGIEIITDDTECYPVKDKTQGSSNIATVLCGYCKLKLDNDAEVPFLCYTKKFKLDSHVQFYHTIQAMCIMRHVHQLKPYWPDVHDINYKETMITTAFLEGERLDIFFKTIDVFNESNRDLGKKIFGALGKLFDILFENDVYHGNLQCKNLFVRNHGGELHLKIINFDDMRLYSRDDPDYRRFGKMNLKDISDTIESMFGYIGVGNLEEKLNGYETILKLSMESNSKNEQMNEWLEDKITEYKPMADMRRLIRVH